MFPYARVWLLILCGLSCPSELLSKDSCSRFFTDRAQSQLASIDTAEDFFSAMTRGLWLSEKQTPLFSFYLRSVFGDAKTHLNGKKLERVFSILKQYPELNKSFFPEVILTETQVHRPLPADFDQWTRAFLRNTQGVRAKFSQLQANKGWWQQRLPSAPQASGMEAVLLSIDSFVEPKWQEELRHTDDDSLFENTKYLFKKLQVIYKAHLDFEPNSAHHRRLTQAFVDLIHSSPLASPRLQNDLKSPDPMERLQALEDFLFMREQLSQHLGFQQGWSEVLSHFSTKAPTGVDNPQDLGLQVQRWREQILTQPPTQETQKDTRIRSLSLQESPFRSCLGGSDCSTQNYFEKALDPNYIYFTATDTSHRSSGQVTLVLGTARNSSGEMIKVAFVDKIQNIPHQKLPAFLEGVRRSLHSQSYTLALPEDVGTGRGLSNTPAIRNFVDQVMKPENRSLFTEYRPHPNPYKFMNKYSRAEDSLTLWALPGLESADTAQWTLGTTPKTQLASEELHIQQLLAPILELRHSPHENDQLAFTNHSKAMEDYSRYGFDDKIYWQGIEDLAHNSPFLKVKKQALYALILDKEQDHWLQSLSLPETLWQQLLGEIPQWKKSHDQRKQRAYLRLTRLNYNDLATMTDPERSHLLQQSFRDINATDDFGATPLILASLNQDMNTLTWIMNQPETNPNLQDNETDTALMWAARLGYEDVVSKLIADDRVDLQVRDQNDQTALDMALEFEHRGVIHLLKDELARRGLQ